ncbi:hypothetical protein [Streptomyces sp. AC495_CC817]|uniref:hypothetical protein n=1 Tax=Streptomyces sp. AC495_CC817 TaxID=2823900 RepID=UPI001C280B34|nr:hypothetical protein [Streptomyces sp. AC495_CC817]
MVSSSVSVTYSSAAVFGAHLIPVVDGGIAVDARGGRLHGAEWRALIAAPGRACLECLGQYDPAHVQAEGDGSLDDPAYTTGLPADHPLRRKENVFVFSASAAAAQLNQFVTMTTAPSGIADTGAHLYHLTTATLDHHKDGCKTSCPYDGMLRALGDDAPVTVTGRTAPGRRTGLYCSCPCGTPLAAPRPVRCRRPPAPTPLKPPARRANSRACCNTAVS